MKKILSFILVVAMLVCGVATFASCGKDGEKTYKIGMSGPLTGGAAIYGLAVKNGAQLAVDEINAAGGLFGTKLELLTYDDEHKPDKVAGGYATLLESGMQISIGCVTSAPCAEFAALSKEDDVFFITPSASNDAIPKNANGYQMCFADGNQGKAAAAYVNENYAGQTIGILYQAGDNYSEGIYEQFKANLDASITTIDATFAKDASDFATQANTLKNVGFVFLPIYYDPAYLFMKEMAKAEHNTQNTVYYGCDGLDGIDSIEGADFSDITAEISYLSHFNSAATEGAAKDFVDAYKAKYGETPIQFAAAAYDCVYAIYNALKAAGEDKVNPDMAAEDFCKILTAAFDGDFTFSGATGTNMKWNRATTGYGYVEKAATKYVVKEAAAK